jgi:hypothetical protein
MREAYDTTLVAASAASTNPQHVLAADALDPFRTTGGRESIDGRSSSRGVRGFDTS